MNNPLKPTRDEVINAVLVAAIVVIFTVVVLAWPERFITTWR